MTDFTTLHISIQFHNTKGILLLKSTAKILDVCPLNRLDKKAFLDCDLLLPEVWRVSNPCVSAKSIIFVFLIFPEMRQSPFYTNIFTISFRKDNNTVALFLIDFLVIRPASPTSPKVVLMSQTACVQAT